MPNQPTAVYLRSWARLLMRGDEDAIRGMVRAMIAQLVVFHCPDDLWLALCVAPGRRAEWEWAKWLPHNLNPHDNDGAGPVRMIATDFPELEGMLGAEFWERPQYDPEAHTGREEPYTLIVVDGATVPAGHPLDGPGMRNVTVLDLSGALTWRPGRTTLRLDVRDGELRLVRTDRDRKEQTTLLGRNSTSWAYGARPRWPSGSRRTGWAWAAIRRNPCRPPSTWPRCSASPTCTATTRGHCGASALPPSG